MGNVWDVIKGKKELKDLFGEKKEKEYYTELSELTDRNTALERELNAIKIENASIKGQMTRNIAEKNQKLGIEKKKDKNQEIINDLELQKKKIEFERYGDVIDFGAFIKDVYSNKIKIEVTDYEDKAIFGVLKGFYISTKTGEMLLRDEYGNTLSAGQSISTLILKPETIGNQVKRFRIMTPRDEDFHPISNVEEIEMGEYVYDEDSGDYVESKEHLIKIKNYIKKLENKIQDLKSEKEIFEISFINQKNKIDDLNHALKVYKATFENSKSELFQAVGLNIDMTNKTGDFMKEVNKLAQYKVQLEADNEVHKRVADLWREKALALGGETQRDIIESEMLDRLKELKVLLPEEVHVHPEEKKESPRIPKKGEVLANAGLNI